MLSIEDRHEVVAAPTPTPASVAEVKPPPAEDDEDWGDWE